MDTIYTLRSDGAYVTYEGMTQEQITDMLSAQGLTCTFIDKETYDAHVTRP
jgi:hypothetical protein